MNLFKRNKKSKNTTYLVNAQRERSTKSFEDLPFESSIVSSENSVDVSFSLENEVNSPVFPEQTLVSGTRNNSSSDYFVRLFQPYDNISKLSFLFPSSSDLNLIKSVDLLSERVIGQIIDAASYSDLDKKDIASLEYGFGKQYVAGDLVQNYWADALLGNKFSVSTKNKPSYELVKVLSPRFTSVNSANLISDLGWGVLPDSILISKRKLDYGGFAREYVVKPTDMRGNDSLLLRIMDESSFNNWSTRQDK